LRQKKKPSTIQTVASERGRTLNGNWREKSLHASSFRKVPKRKGGESQEGGNEETHNYGSGAKSNFKKIPNGVPSYIKRDVRGQARQGTGNGKGVTLKECIYLQKGLQLEKRERSKGRD